MRRKQRIEWVCDRCGNTWFPKSRKPPGCCPECNNRRNHHPVDEPKEK